MSDGGQLPGHPRAPATSGSPGGASPSSYVLTTACPDTTGIVAAVAGFLAANHCLITEAQHYDDPFSNTSFMRAVFHDNGQGAPSIADLDAAFARSVGAQFRMLQQTPAVAREMHRPDQIRLHQRVQAPRHFGRVREMAHGIVRPDPFTQGTRGERVLQRGFLVRAAADEDQAPRTMLLQPVRDGTQVVE